MYKSLKSISWQVDEPTYREDRALSYSTLSTYERGHGFDSLETLFERKESPSLLFGSIVDTLITDGQEAFEQQYAVAELPHLSEQIENIIKGLFNVYKESYNTLEQIPNNVILSVLDEINYCKTWKPETRVSKVKFAEAEEYYKMLFLTDGKTLISNELYAQANKAVEALRTSSATSYLFAPNNPFEPKVERFYQLKFKATIDGIPYRGMLDEVLVLHDKKIIVPIDLKTSSKKEYNFYKSFVDWSYFLQAKLYTKLLYENIKNDEYFKDFTIKPYIFVVVNKESLNPLCWEFKESLNTDDFVVKDTVYRSPLTIGKELYNYLQNPVSVPTGISLTTPNDIIEWLNK